MSSMSSSGCRDDSAQVIQYISRILACLDYCRSQGAQGMTPLIQSTQGLIRAAFEQWLAMDLRTQGVQDPRQPRCSLEEMQSERKVVLTSSGVWTCQILGCHNIGSAAYG